MAAPTLEMEPVEPQSLKKLSLKSLKRALDLFSLIHGQFAAPDPESKKIRMSHKINVEYCGIKTASGQTSRQANSGAADTGNPGSVPSNSLALTAVNGAGPADSRDSQKGGAQNALVVGPSLQPKGQLTTSAIIERIPSKWPRPVWHRPWKNYRVISGHLGWVRSVAFDPSNNWFCTGSADRTIKIWDVASGRLKLTLTGHIEQIRGLAVSSKHTYMFSAGDDKQVKCWDLEQNKVIRSYHGHLSGVYCLALHPTIDILLTGGRDSVCRDPQIVTGSHDTTIKFWDLRYGKTMSTLTHHKKSVRAMAPHPKEHSFASASADNIKKFSLPKGEFLHNML
ncbi:hypothetical protein GOBAR_DD35303 [Gossypium barbadense]|nr:hypothetical protein GOBAR_DD35303 [Gossypium barbadense]